ncbi:MAG TPA: hypothetical protein DEQ24_07240 [Enterococcus sp.]|nr:hypothetical protein [Enterococcus sp.]
MSRTISKKRADDALFFVSIQEISDKQKQGVPTQTFCLQKIYRTQSNLYMKSIKGLHRLATLGL